MNAGDNYNRPKVILIIIYQDKDWDDCRKCRKATSFFSNEDWFYKIMAKYSTFYKEK